MSNHYFFPRSVRLALGSDEHQRLSPTLPYPPNCTVAICAQNLPSSRMTNPMVLPTRVRLFVTSNLSAQGCGRQIARNQFPRVRDTSNLAVAHCASSNVLHLGLRVVSTASTRWAPCVAFLPNTPTRVPNVAPICQPSHHLATPFIQQTNTRQASLPFCAAYGIPEIPS